MRLKLETNEGWPLVQFDLMWHFYMHNADDSVLMSIRGDEALALKLKDIVFEHYKGQHISVLAGKFPVQPKVDQQKSVDSC